MSEVNWSDVGNILSFLVSVYVAVVTMRRLWHQRCLWIQQIADRVVRVRLCDHWRSILSDFEVVRLSRRHISLPNTAPAAPRPSLADDAVMVHLNSAELSQEPAPFVSESFSREPPPGDGAEVAPVMALMHRDIVTFVGITGHPLVDVHRASTITRDATQTVHRLTWWVGCTRAMAERIVVAAYARIQADVTEALGRDYVRFASVLHLVRYRHASGH